MWLRWMHWTYNVPTFPQCVTIHTRRAFKESTTRNKQSQHVTFLLFIFRMRAQTNEIERNMCARQVSYRLRFICMKLQQQQKSWISLLTTRSTIYTDKMFNLWNWEADNCASASAQISANEQSDFQFILFHLPFSLCFSRMLECGPRYW